MDKKCNLFLPWKFKSTNRNIYFNKVPFSGYNNKLYLKRGNSINWCNKPFFAVLNEKGTVKFFIEAINKNADDEARTYISKSLSENIDLKEVHDIFKEGKNYKCLLNFQKDKQNGVAIVALAVGDYLTNKHEIICVKMIEEPDIHGRWKIYEIEKE